MPSLRDYLPTYEKNYKELKSIQEALDPEIYGSSGTYSQIDELENDLFILTASENGISRYERLLKISPTSTDTLETRRMRVLIKWNNRIPYTMRVLQDKLISVFGEGNCEIDASRLTDYILRITAHFSEPRLIDDLWMILKMMLPANLVVSMINELESSTSTTIHASAATFTEEEMAPDIYEGYSIDRSLDTTGYAGIINYDLKESEVK